MIFTFKTEKPTGQYKAFFPNYHYIKFKKRKCGQIIDNTWNIKLTVIKEDIMEDGNPNCKWKWITLKKKFESLQEAKDFLNTYIEEIMKKFNLYFFED